MVTRLADIWACARCHNLQGKHDQWFDGNICEECYDKAEEARDARWHAQLDTLHKLIGKQQTPEQEQCAHEFKIVPKSGKRFGIKLWVCDHCTKVVQAS